MKLTLTVPIGLPAGRYSFSKITRVMKLTTILILTASLHVAASKVAGQNVTMRLKDVPIKTVLLKIQKQTGLDFLIDESILESAGRVSLDVKGMPVSSVLKLCLEDKPLSYSISNGRIVVPG